jgi:hypothetical protein
MVRRFFVVVFGFALAVSIGAVFLIIGSVVDPIMRELGLEATLSGFFVIMEEAAENGAPDQTFRAFRAMIGAVFFGTCVAPLVIAAVVGELAELRAWSWYAGSCALLAGASPWIVRAASGVARASQITPLESRVALLFFLTGAVTGTIYWLVAARGEDPRA